MATDLDAYVTEMLLKEAKEREAKYGKEGLKAYFSDEEQEGPKHRTNKRFLASMIKSVDGHNQALLRAEAEEERRKDRTIGPISSGSRLFALAKSNMGGSAARSASTSKLTEPSQRSRHPDRSDSNWRTSKGNEPARERDPEADRHRKRRRSRSPDRDRDRYSDGHRRRREDREGKGERSERRHRSSRYDSQDDTDTARSSRRRSRRHSSTDSEDSYSRKSSRRHDRHSKRDRSRDRARDGRSKGDEERSSRHRSHRRESDPSRSSRSKAQDKPEPPTEVLPGVPRVQAPSRSPTPPTQDPGDAPRVGPSQPSKMDKYFAKSYDPRLDVSVAELTDPSTGYIAEGNFDQWSAMLETLKVRKAEKAFRQGEREREKELAKEKEREERRRKKVAKQRAKAGLPIEEEIGPSPAPKGAQGLMDMGYVRDKSSLAWNMDKAISFD